MAAQPVPVQPTDIPILERAVNGYKCGNWAIQRGLSDEQLAFLYARFKSDKTLDLLFYEHSMSLKEWIDTYLDPQHCTLGCFKADATGKWDLYGLGWINEVVRLGGKYLRGNIGQGFVRHAESPLRFGQMMLAWAFEQLNLDLLMGVTPAANRAACIFPRKLGFTMSGPVPCGTVWRGELAEVWISTMTKEQWQTVSPWREG